MVGFVMLFLSLCIHKHFNLNRANSQHSPVLVSWTLFSLTMTLSIMERGGIEIVKQSLESQR